MNKKKYCSAVIPAAGTGIRMGTEIKKQFLKLGEKEIITWTIEKFEQCHEVDEIILATAKDMIELLTQIVKRENFKKVSAIVEGGTERQHSVYAGLCATKKETEIVVVHDGRYYKNDCGSKTKRSLCIGGKGKRYCQNL